MTAVVSLGGGGGAHLPVGKNVVENPDEAAVIPIPACQLALSMVTEGVM